MTSDNDLRLEIQNVVTRLWGTRASDIDVQVVDGVVTLTGKLQSDMEQWNLRDEVNGTPGVERVIDETLIVPEPSVRTAAADIARPWFSAD